MTVVISILNAIGDAFLAQSAILSLVKKHENDRTILIIPSDVAETAYKYIKVDKRTLQIDRSYFYPYYSLHLEKIKLKETLEKPDYLYSLTKFYPLPVYDLEIIDTLSPLNFIGFDKKAVQSLKHSSEKYFEYFTNIFPHEEFIQKRVPIIPEELELDICKQINESFNNRPYIVFHTDTAEPKEWSLEGWRNLLRIAQPDYDIVLIGKPKPEILSLFHSFQAKIVKADWHASCIFIKYSKLFIGVDSCFAHVADAYEKRGMIIWGLSTEKTQYDRLLRQYEFGHLSTSLVTAYNDQHTNLISPDAYDYVFKKLLSS